jgi:histidinol-phosphate aminotransferase
VPDHVVTVLDQAYFEYVEHPEYADGIEEYAKTGRKTIVLRTFSKIFGLAGLRVGYGVGPEELVTAVSKVRRAFDISSPAQVAALASLHAPGAAAEVERRRRLNAEGRPAIVAALREHGFDPVTPAVANFVFAEVGEDSRPLFEQLLREGVIVRPTRGFGAPGGIRVTVGTPEENAFFAEALGRVVSLAQH